MSKHIKCLPVNVRLTGEDRLAKPTRVHAMSFVQVAASDHPPLTVTYELETLLGIQMGAVNAQKTTPEILVLYTVDLVIDGVDTVMVRPTLIVTIVSIMHIGVRMKSASVMNTG